MKMINMLILAFIPILGFGQKVTISKKHGAEKTIIINLYSAYKERKTYPLSTIAEDIEYIPLEKTDKCLIGSNLNNVYVTSENIFVFDFNLCYRFDRQGKFLNRIGKIGRGPGECIRPIDMVVDSVNHCVYLLDIDKLVKYDYNGNCIKDYKLRFYSNDILFIENGTFLLNNMSYQHADAGKRFSLNFFSEKQEKTISKVACEKKDKIPFCICNPPMYKYDRNTFLKDFWSNTIYKVEDPFNLKAYATIQTGKLKHRDNDDMSGLTGKENPGDKLVIEINFISETDRFIFLSSNKGLFFYDKLLKETHCCNYLKANEKWYSFTNDLTGGPNQVTYSFPKVTINDNTFVTFNHAHEFFETEGNNSNAKLKKVIKYLSPDDNPVLVFVKIKQ